MFASHGRDRITLQWFAKDLRAHDGQPEAVQHACIDTSAGDCKRVLAYLPNAQISYERFHFVKLASQAMDAVRTATWKATPPR